METEDAGCLYGGVTMETHMEESRQLKLFTLDDGCVVWLVFRWSVTDTHTHREYCTFFVDYMSNMRHTRLLFIISQRIVLVHHLSPCVFLLRSALFPSYNLWLRVPPRSFPKPVSLWSCIFPSHHKWDTQTVRGGCQGGGRLMNLGQDRGEEECGGGSRGMGGRLTPEQVLQLPERILCRVRLFWITPAEKKRILAALFEGCSGSSS